MKLVHQRLQNVEVPCPRCDGLLGANPGGASCLNAGCAIVLTDAQVRRWETLRAQGERGETLLRLGTLGEIQVGARMQGVRERVHEPMYDTLTVPEDTSRFEPEPERIVAAALLVNGRVWSLPAPARHHNVIRHYGKEARARLPSGHLQGFVTSRDRFVGREEAAAIATEAGQLSKPCSYLYSEDVW